MLLSLLASNDFSGIRIMWHYWPDSLIERLDCLHCNCQEIDGENGYKKSISLPGRGSRISESNFPLKCVLGSLWFLDSHSFSPVIFHPFSSRISRIQRTLRMTHVDCSGAPYRPQGKNGAFYVERSIRIKNHQPESDLNERLSEWLCDWLNDWLARVRPSEPFDCLIDARSYWLIDAFVDLWLLKCLPNTFFLTGYFELLSSFEGVMVTFYVLRLKSFS